MANKTTDIAERIIAAREAQGLSRQALAKKLKTSYLNVYRIETGATDVSIPIATRYARALKVSIESLLFGRDRAAS